MAQPERAILEMLGAPLSVQTAIARKYGISESDIDAALQSANQRRAEYGTHPLIQSHDAAVDARPEFVTVRR
jgi:hypothetical protein